MAADVMKWLSQADQTSTREREFELQHVCTDLRTIRETRRLCGENLMRKLKSFAQKSMKADEFRQQCGFAPLPMRRPALTSCLGKFYITVLQISKAIPQTRGSVGFLLGCSSASLLQVGPCMCLAKSRAFSALSGDVTARTVLGGCMCMSASTFCCSHWQSDSFVAPAYLAV